MIGLFSFRQLREDESASSLILISPPTFKTGEVDLLCKLFDAGLKRFHLRKPNCKSEELREYLKQVPRKYLPNIVIHRYSELVKEFDLGGYHYRSDEPSSEIFSTSSRSYHKLNELKDMSEKLDYIFSDLFMSPYLKLAINQKCL